ncbi:MAG: hypothetical protein K6F99_04130 [Lachnospiraceae bacterium]|nr:hypothetical protein [Lachnospiraceae bacterium]
MPPIDNYVYRYCPYHNKQEMHIIKLKGYHKYNGDKYDYFWCPITADFFYERDGAYYDLNEMKIM